MSTVKTKEESLEKTGKCALESILEMVAALNCDYDRLEELKDERETLQDEVDAISKSADIDEDAQNAIDALADWDEENAEELKDLTEAAGDCTSQDEARDRIMEDPLSLEFRSGWVTDKSELTTAEEYRLLLSTGGPATRIIGELDEHGQASSARLEVQDWFTPWMEHVTTGSDHEALLTYANCFCFE